MRQPQFLSGTRGQLFSLWFKPEPASVDGHAVVFVPPFAEELNKSRRMMALQGEALARRGCGMLSVDLYGTGDSQGAFADADWDTWQADLTSAVDWLKAQGIERISLLAQRFGALPALDFLDRSPLPVSRLVFWHPVVKGQQAVTQFLRLRIAAGMMTGEDKETAAGLRQLSADGETLEVAGYGLSPALVAAMDKADMADADPGKLPPVNWLELIPAADRQLSPAARSRIAAWSDAGADVTGEAVVGDSFWATQEIATAPGLIEITTDRLLT